MGIFDVFTGSSAKKAAAENKARLDQLKVDGLGYLDAGKTGALGALDTAAASFKPLADLGAKYGGGTDLYLDSLGVNGADGNGRAVDAFRAGPGYDFKVNSALDSLDRRAASRGMLASGNTSLDTLSTVTGLADQAYGGWQDRLGGLISPELAATGGAASGVAGANMAKAPVYTNDANARVGLSSGVTTGLNSQATQAANAEMMGSGNLWNFGLNLTKLGSGFLGGGAGAAGGGNLGNVGGGVFGNFKAGY